MSEARVAVVTGGANGIGEAAAAGLVAQGRDVALLDRDAGLLEEVAARLRGLRPGARVAGFAVDVTDGAGVKRAFGEVEAALGRAQILVNSVGGSTSQRSIEEISDEEWDSVIDLNLRSAFLCTRAVVPGMKAGRWGRIVCLSSVAGRTRSLFGGPHYTASKAAVIGMCRQLAYQLAPHGITANVVAPGVTLSPRVAAKWEAKAKAERDFIQSLIPAGRPAACSEVASSVVFLCGEDAGYVNGAVIDVNGGLHIP